MGEKAVPGGWEELRFGGASRPRGCGRVLRVVGGCVRGDVSPREGLEKRLVVVVRLGWWVCRPRCVRGLVRPCRPPWRRALGACRGAKVGARAVR